MENLVQNYEKLSINAIPAQRVVYYHGWIIQLDKGYKDRANSVYPLYPSNFSMEEMVSYCEDLYSRYSIEPRFKLTAFSHPPELNSYLDSLGYVKYSETSFQTLNLNGNYAKSKSDDFQISKEMTEEWFETCCLWNHIPSEKKLITKEIWNRISVKVYFCKLLQDNEVDCVGFIVQLQDLCGIYSVTVNPKKRHRGFGTKFMNELFSFALEKGIKTCYLQVETSNDPAMGLYAKLGFKEQYCYWYRKKLAEV